MQRKISDIFKRKCDKDDDYGGACKSKAIKTSVSVVAGISNDNASTGAGGNTGSLSDKDEKCTDSRTGNLDLR